MIFFIAAMAIAVAVVWVGVGVVQDLSGGLKTKGQIMSQELKTDIEIINDPRAVSSNPLILYVKNTGSTTLNSKAVTVLVDGKVMNPIQTRLPGFKQLWEPTAVLEIKITAPLVRGDHWAKVVAENGASDTISFKTKLLPFGPWGL